ncbi:uncharacterized protein LOC119097465 [Pollicipes pollicipes]|uniref:uncharacterized protein LOC119097465 n=1 Tax=Pollicipes pollicipes TaxID=41117 RepID=UPI001884B454|nr:uncharacterized protein LOC119097465 [Pollicipes pollicipes]
MPHNIRLFSDVGAKMSMFDTKAKKHKENQMINPFSEWDGSGTRRKISREDPNYGRPLEGSKTAERGKQAQVQMIADMVEMCDVIFDCGIQSPDGRGAICFGDVFRLYSAINDKCVGLLMRGRKHNILDFEGEMLFQRRDDDKMIELLLPLNTIRYKYGMPARAGCGDVCPELLEELERQQKMRQPRARSLELLEPPHPAHQKSRSMELDTSWTRAAEGGAAEAACEPRWTLQVPGQAQHGRRACSAENLSTIDDDAAEAAARGSAARAEDGEQVEGAAGGAEGGEEVEGAVGGVEDVGQQSPPNAASDAAASERLPSPTIDFWEATSAEHPADDAAGGGTPPAPEAGLQERPPLPSPQITVSDEDEPLPAR